MRRKFADLNVIVDDVLTSLDKLNLMIRLLSELGFKLVALSTSNTTKLPILKKLTRSISVDFSDLNLVMRLSLSPSSPSELLRLLAKFRRSVEVICINCNNRQVASVAARDRRVDLLAFDPLSKVGFTPSHANLASSRENVALEITFWRLIESPKIVAWERVHRWIEIAREYSIPIILTSGANEPLKLRSPRDMAPILMLFGFRKEEALDSISTIPYKLVEVNKRKLKPDFIAPGIKIVGRGTPYEISTKIPDIQDYKPRKL